MWAFSVKLEAVIAVIYKVTYEKETHGTCRPMSKDFSAVGGVI